MQIAIYHDPPDLSLYLVEMLKTWGLPLYHLISPENISGVHPEKTPVLLCPAGHDYSYMAESLADYVRGGGQVICMLPDASMASMAGLVCEGPKETPLRLRICTHPAAGLAGELLPVVGEAGIYQPDGAVDVLAYLTHPGRYHDESAGITETRLGQGRIITFAFDLAMCVLLMRQGDPSLTEIIPPGDGCARPSHMAIDIGPNDAAWLPYADLLARLLLDQVRRLLPGPVPLLSHLPGSAQGLLLYSGDEDGATIAANEDEFDAVHAARGRMNLYIIPTGTHSTIDDVQRYGRHHDVGPHPNLRPLDGRTVTERITEFERQIHLFEDMYGVQTRSLRNHCTAWAGYLEPVAVMEKLGIRMDGNYFSGTYMKDRESAPYAGFGAAMPMRFCEPDGRMYEVFQQHTHLSDDVLFGDADYSFRFSPAQFDVILNRIFTEMVTRFHTPYAVCIHPGNWVKFSCEQGLALLHRAGEYNIPIWSFDQWSIFWDARDTWRFKELSWQENTLRCKLEGQETHEGLCLVLPDEYEGVVLKDVRINEMEVIGIPVVRYGVSVRLLPVPDGLQEVEVMGRYQLA